MDKYFLKLYGADEVEVTQETYTYHTRKTCSTYEIRAFCTPLMSGRIEKEEEPTLTEFQKLIVNCKPEINKPVFVLSGAGAGVTFALNERAKKEDFAYVHPNAHTIYPKLGHLNYVLPCNIYGYDNVVFDCLYDIDVQFSYCKYNKVIICITPYDFVESFAPKLRGEYTVISGYNVNDNLELNKNHPEYKKHLDAIPTAHRDRLLHGVWK